MHWPDRLNAALEYIEQHLKGAVTAEDVARAAYCSKFHFHRVFYANFAITCADYIRKRKMTLAAADVLHGEQSIVDIAQRYGYDSPNAFTRAFRSVHNVNPSAVRTQAAALSSYQRISMTSAHQGGIKVEYKIVHKPEFTLVGASKMFDFDGFVKEGPKYWKDYVGSEAFQDLINLSHAMPGEQTAAPLISAYFPIEQGSRDEFVDLLGIELSAKTDSKGFERRVVPSATYAEFDCTYKSSMKTNRYIYGEWFAATGYERDGEKPDIVAYFPIPFRPMSEMRVRWWIPVKHT